MSLLPDSPGEDPPSASVALAKPAVTSLLPLAEVEGPAPGTAVVPDFTPRAVCPHCQTEMILRALKGQYALYAAMLAQASCRGTELHCTACGQDFIYSRPPLPDSSCP